MKLWLWMACVVGVVGAVGCGGASKEAPATQQSLGADGKGAKQKTEPPPPFSVEVVGFDNGGVIPEQHAFCKPGPKGKSAMGDNVSPEVRWANAPAGTKSFALVVVDPDVPTNAALANKKKPLPSDSERMTFYHWVVKDIPATSDSIAKGAGSEGITPKGKPVGQVAYGVTGVNDYGVWFKKDKKMAGSYGGYDGPCPPWNDERLHHYHFRVYALDVEQLEVTEPMDGRTLEGALEGHILAQAEWVGVYTLNPSVQAAQAAQASPASPAPQATEENPEAGSQ
jgi:Raf kinase inhibitor-like YbhB/YbcL family protein